MMIYVADMGWEGYAVAVAENVEEALVFIKENHPRPWNFKAEDLQAYPFVKGYVDGNVGDA